MRKTILAFTLIVFAAACSTNLATGQRQFNIVSEGQEISIGQRSHREIIKQFGVYDEKSELNRLVDRVGRQLTAASERPNLPWTFTILDTPMLVRSRALGDPQHARRRSGGKPQRVRPRTHTPEMGIMVKLPEEVMGDRKARISRALRALDGCGNSGNED